MAPLLNLCLAVLITVSSIIPDTVRANSLQATPQPTPSTSPTPTGKHPDAPPVPPQPSPNPDASGKYHVGDGVTAPRLLYQAAPEFSEKLRKNKITGSCVVSITVDIDGNSQNAHIIKSHPDTNDKNLRNAVMEIQDSCVKAAKQYRFKPATYQGKPIPVETTVEIDFQIF